MDSGLSESSEEFFEAISQDDVEKAKECFKQGASLTAIDPDGNTILHEAAGCGSNKVLEWLIKEHCSVGIIDKVNDDGNTPLHQAVLMGEIETMKLLYNAYHSNYNQTNKAGKTAYYILENWHPQYVAEWDKFIKENTENPQIFVDKQASDKDIL